MLLIQADARRIPLPDGYVQCVVTSPPYWGLRDYGVAGQLGMESTPEAYVQDLVEIFREVRRVLREDGTVWLNLGDSYARNPAKGGSGPNGKNRDWYGDNYTRAVATRRGVRQQQRDDEAGVRPPEGEAPGGTPPAAHGMPDVSPSGIKAKDLVGIPWRVAFALQADGWYLRSDIIWAKPNPMPESVTDRPTRSHEYVFLLTKREKYFYDHHAIREQAVKKPMKMQADPETIRQKAVGPHARGAEGFNHQYADRERLWAADGGRNRRTVWTITPKPYKGAHFATFPAQLVEPCLLAGTPEGGCCAACGTPLRRVIEKGEPRREQQRACGSDANGNYDGTAQKDYATAGAQNASEVKARILAGMVGRRTVGWVPTCDCGGYRVRSVSSRRMERGSFARRCWYRNDWQSRIAARWGLPAASVVLDPFCGSGTTGQVAQREGRFFIGLDLKMDYLKLAQARIEGRVTETPITDKQAGHGRRHAGFNARYFGTGTVDAPDAT